MPPLVTPPSVIRPSVVVTGDVVLDCHLYGPKAGDPTSQAPGTAYRQRLGGAALTEDLLRFAFDAKVRDYERERKEWETENEARKTKGEEPQKWPPDLPLSPPELDCQLGITRQGLEHALPDSLRSYGVWTPHPKNRDAGTKTRVWRVEHDFGYGRPGTLNTAAAGDGGYAFAGLAKDGLPYIGDREVAGRAVSPTLTVLDDGALTFRHVRNKAVWHVPNGGATSWFLLKMSAPLCQGDLWEALAPVRDRLIVIVSANDLRRADIQIRRRLSWEQCAEDTLRALTNDPIAKALGQAAHVIVNFQSAGALWVRRTGDKTRSARLIFDPLRLEGDYGAQFEGNVYGRQTCLAVGVAYHLLSRHASWHTAQEPKLNALENADVMANAIEDGVRTGLTARRTLLELGHGEVGSKEEPGLPVAALSELMFKAARGFESALAPPGAGAGAPPWTILREAELGDAPAAPLVDLAEAAALHGADALSHVPALKMGSLFTVDRGEIQSLRTLESLIRAYEDGRVQKKPLSIGVFGPPGAGKSFGVKALAQGVLGKDVPFLEFNLSQFNGPADLIGAFHRVRDAVLGGVTPVAFWDEFDSQEYKWLQYLLAPMQDGAFQEREVTHPIGKCIFIFAGGTSSTLADFGVAEQAAARYQAFKFLKGPDFISRLHGFLNVLGPSPLNVNDVEDISWPIRRARILRTLLGLKDGDLLDIDEGLLHALIAVPTLKHGARSFEKIVSALASGRDNGRIHRSSLLPDPVLARETDVEALHKLMYEHNDSWLDVDLEVLAIAIHDNFLDATGRAKAEALAANEPSRIPTIHPGVQKDFDKLDDDKKAANRGAALRIPRLLALLDFKVALLFPGEGDDWKTPLNRAIEQHIDRLARTEHVGWCAERIASGWTPAKVRNDKLKQHALLVPWAQLSRPDQDKDRSSVRAIPEFLKKAGRKAVPSSTL